MLIQTVREPPPESPVTNASTSRTLAWIAILSLASVAFSLSFACATPLAAFAALAATRQGRADGAALVIAVWGINQAVGFGCLGYPLDAHAFAWGATMLVATLAGAELARRAAALARHEAARLVAALVVAFAGYEAALYLAQIPLGWDAGAYAPSVVATIGWTNALAFAGLLAAREAAARVGLAPRARRDALAA